MVKWRSIKGYGHYEVSDGGRVRRKGRKILKAGTRNGGYRQVILCKDGKRKTCKIASLVAKNFIRKPKLMVNHKNSNRADDHLSNLEWVTHKENILHGVLNKQKEEGKGNKLSIEIASGMLKIIGE